MLGGNTIQSQALARSYASWWRLAGVDSAVSDDAHGWLQPDPGADALDALLKAPSAVAVPANAAGRAADVKPSLARPPVADGPLPATLEALQAALAMPGQLAGCGHGRQLVAPIGTAKAPVMIVGDCPTPADIAAGQPFAEAEGRLVAAMLRAIGLDFEQSYRALLAGSRPPSGRLDAAEVAETGALLRHHIDLAQPQTLILFGDAPARALTGQELRAARGRLHHLNHEGASLSFIVTHHPRTLLGHPELKREAWEDLKLLLRGDRPS